MHRMTAFRELVWSEIKGLIIMMHGIVPVP